MTVDLDGRVIRGVNLGSAHFRSRWWCLPGAVQDEAIGIIKSLIGANMDKLPRKLHLHQLVSHSTSSAIDNKRKVPVWSLHITADDRYKASFTYEDGILYFRNCGMHDAVDKKP